MAAPPFMTYASHDAPANTAETSGLGNITLASSGA
jgi:hypothetical protein